MLESRRLMTIAGSLALLILASGAVFAQPPSGYYDSVDDSSSVALRQSLHPVIDDHTRFPYTSSSTDTWDILNLADEDPNDTGRVVDIYKNASYAKISGGSGAYNREHSWPKSYGFPSNVSSNYPYTDAHHLFVSDSGYNSSRSNKPYRTCDAGCSEKTTNFTDGRGGGSGTYAGNSNWTEGSYTQGTWETWIGRRGDVARALMYLDVRYEGGSHGVTGHDEPDLILTDIESLIAASNTGSNESSAYMGMLSTLILWHQQDPVDSREIWRNEVVYSFQGNRNPFIDHPEWVDCLFLDQCSGGGPDVTPPAPPTGLTATGGDGQVELSWSPNGESDLSGYNVYRATASGGPYTKINTSQVVGEAYTDTGLTNGTSYYYVITALDTSGNESGDSTEAVAVPQAGGGGGGGGIVISEVFYDAPGSDNGLEWVELFNTGSSAVDLSGYSLGAGGTSYTYSTVQLSGTIQPGATFVVGGPTSSSSNGNPSFDQSFNFSPDFQNSGSTADGVALFDVPASQITGSTVPIDAVVYGGSNSSGLIDESGSASAPEVGDAGSGDSIERIDNAGSWRIQTSPTPNSVDGTDLTGGGGGAGQVILSEVFYDASGGDDGKEWVELYNAGGTAVDLSGYSVGAAGTSYTYTTVQLSGTIQPGATFVVGGPSSSSSNGDPSFDQVFNFGPDIQNSGSTADGVALFDVPASQITGSTVPIDAVIYGGSNSNGLIDETGSAASPEVGDAPSGSSIERVDLGGSWRIQSSPTPNTIAGTDL